MPEMQPPVPATPAPIPLLAEPPLLEDPDYALGCECAVPALQIAQWVHEARPEAA
jgi:hypothetical protein